MKKSLILSLLVITSLNSFSQKTNLFESKEYKESYEAGTRSRSGMPGVNYWQNKSDYSIKASFDPTTQMIIGQLSVKYFNNSPDSLNTLVFKLMQNVYKKGAVRQMEVDTGILHDGMVIKDVKFNEEELEKANIAISGTVMRIHIPKSIRQNASGYIALDFITPIPKKSGFRSGTIDSTSFFAAYWFPQIAVYDDIFGWDTDEYVGIPENYNDFSNYNVELTLP